MSDRWKPIGLFRPTVQCEMAKSVIARKDRGLARVDDGTSLSCEEYCAVSLCTRKMSVGLWVLRVWSSGFRGYEVGWGFWDLSLRFQDSRWGVWGVRCGDQGGFLRFKVYVYTRDLQFSYLGLGVLGNGFCVAWGKGDQDFFYKRGKYGFG